MFWWRCSPGYGPFPVATARISVVPKPSRNPALSPLQACVKRTLRRPCRAPLSVVRCRIADGLAGGRCGWAGGRAVRMGWRAGGAHGPATVAGWLDGWPARWVGLRLFRLSGEPLLGHCDPGFGASPPYSDAALALCNWASIGPQKRLIKTQPSLTFVGPCGRRLHRRR